MGNNWQFLFFYNKSKVVKKKTIQKNTLKTLKKTWIVQICIALLEVGASSKTIEGTRFFFSLGALSGKHGIK